MMGIVTRQRVNHPTDGCSATSDMGNTTIGIPLGGIEREQVAMKLLE